MGSLFEDCFGDLPEETQEHLKKVLTAMTRVINKELKDTQLTYPEE